MTGTRPSRDPAVFQRTVWGLAEVPPTPLADGNDREAHPYARSPDREQVAKLRLSRVSGAFRDRPPR